VAPELRALALLVDALAESAQPLLELAPALPVQVGAAPVVVRGMAQPSAATLKLGDASEELGRPLAIVPA